MDKSGAQLTVETLLGKDKAEKIHEDLMAKEKVLLKLQGRERVTIWWAHPYFRTNTILLDGGGGPFFLEARGGGMWADPAEFVWASLALLLMQNLGKVSHGIGCISFFGRETYLKQTPRLRKKVEGSK